MTRQATRIANLKRLVNELGSIAAVAAAADTSEKYLSQIINGHSTATGNPRSLGDAVADKLERGCLKPTGWMDTPETTALGPELTREEAEILRRYRSTTPDHKRAILAMVRLKIAP